MVIATMIFSTAFLNAQEYVYFGAKGGVNFSTFSGDGFSDFEGDAKARTAYHLGLLAEVPVSDRFSIQPEVLYSAQGYDITDIEGMDDLEYRLDYVTVPLLAKVYLVDGFSLEAGPQAGFLVNSEISNGDSDFDLDDENFKKVDLSLGLGAAIKLSNFFIYGRYNAGMTEISDNDGDDAKNSVIQAGVGFLF